MRAGLQRRLATGVNAILVGVFAVIVVVLLVDLGGRWRFRWDLTQEGGATLAADTLDALGRTQGIEGPPVEVIATSHQRRNDEARYKDRRVRDLLREITLVAPGIRTTFVDLDRDRATAESLEISQYGTLVVRRGDVRVDFRERDVFRRAGDPKAGEASLEFRGEAFVSRGIRQVLSGKSKRILVIEGHGEPAIADPGSAGLARLVELLERQGWDVDSLDLLRDRDGSTPPAVPTDAHAVLLVAPKTALEPSETEALRGFLRRGGAFLAFLEPDGHRPEIATDLGLELRAGVAMDRPSIVPFDDWWIPGVANHAIVSGMEDDGLKVIFARGLPIRALKREGVTATALLRSGRNGWVERQAEPPPADLDIGVDEPGPVDVAFAVQIDRSSGLVDETARAVVVGDATLIGSELMDRLGNPTFALNAVRWALGEDESMAVAGRQARIRTISLSPDGLSRVGWLVVGIWPLLAVIAGALVAYARRGR